jgi:hypothetical protein
LSNQLLLDLLAFSKLFLIMGQDIFIRTDNQDSAFEADYIGYHGTYNLSRTFCNFMGRKYAISGESELDQIGRITSIDISPIYQMEDHPSDEALKFFMGTAGSEVERQRILDETRLKREHLKGNIDKVKAVINALIENLSVIDNLHQILNDSGRDTLNYKIYFTDFNIDKGEGYIGNNFGQDLRNFKRLVEYAKKHGATTVYFDYG